MTTTDLDQPHNVVVPFENAHAAFSFLAEIDQLGYTGIVIDTYLGEEVDATEYEETTP